MCISSSTQPSDVIAVSKGLYGDPQFRIQRLHVEARTLEGYRGFRV
ncbi:hypothetical protein CASFOL_022967 [Castilleja foliolosa]|uniref:Uncharacterized protein n=1 Tax=Castilleja foliolosa TaxID=1961234 RepID=A0ABD3CX18_9LAMI